MDGFLAITRTAADPAADPRAFAPLAAAILGRYLGQGQPCLTAMTQDTVLVATLAGRASDSVLQVEDSGAFTYVNGPLADLRPSTRERPGAAGFESSRPDRRIGDLRSALGLNGEAAPRLPDLTGSFHALHHDPQGRCSALLVDRLGSRPIFVAEGQGVLCAASDIRLLLDLPFVDRTLDVEGFAQLVRMHMVLEERTLYRSIRRLPPAVVLEIDHRAGELTTSQWWTLIRPSPFTGVEDAIEGTAAAFRAATRRLLSNSRKASLLLSGGLDSRMLAACAGEASACDLRAHTFGADGTGETILARRSAQIAGLSWLRIEQVPADYWAGMPAIVSHSNGLYAFHHAHTFSSAACLAQDGCDTVLNGWGLDAFFSGSYLPKIYISLFGRKLHTFRLGRLSGPQEVYGHLLKTLDAQGGSFEQSGLAGPLRQVWQEAAPAALRRELDKAQRLSDNPYDWVEDGAFGLGIARFRSFPVVTSIRAALRERNPLFESDVIEAYQRLPVAWRFLGPVFRRALERLSPELGRLTYFNTGVSPLAPPPLQALSVNAGMLWRSGAARGRSVLRRCHLPVRAAPPYGNYPEPVSLVRWLAGEDVAARQVRSLLLDGPLTQSHLVDRQQVERMIEDCRQGAGAGAGTVLMLVSMATWFDTQGLVCH